MIQEYMLDQAKDKKTSIISFNDYEGAVKSISVLVVERVKELVKM
jgi:hypothetical protein